MNDDKKPRRLYRGDKVVHLKTGRIETVLHIYPSLIVLLNRHRLTLINKDYFMDEYGSLQAMSDALFGK